MSILYGEAHEERGEEAKTGTLSFTPAIVGSLEAAEVVKLLLVEPSLLGELITVDLMNGTIEKIHM